MHKPTCLLFLLLSRYKEKLCAHAFRFNICIHSSVSGCKTVTGYPAETVITQFHFSIPINRLLKIPTEHVRHTNGSLMCVGNGDATVVIFNIEAGYYYSKSMFVMTKETCVHIDYFIHSGVFMCFYKIVYEYPGIRRFTILGIRFPK